MYTCISLVNSVWIPESPPIWERAADLVYHLSHLFTDNVTSYCKFFPLVYCGQSFPSYFWDLIVSVPHRCPLKF